MNFEETRRRTAYDLTLEYVRQSKMIHDCYYDIPKKVKEINDIYKSFYDSLEGKDIINR